MISIIIPTFNSERTLVPTLAPLVAGSAAGLVREVVLVDGGSRDDTKKIADLAGCEFLNAPADKGARLAAGAAAARGTWLLFLDPGAVLEESWTGEVATFMGRTEAAHPALDRAAVFRLAVDGVGLGPRLTEAAAALRSALIGRPRPEQGLLIAKRFYDSLGGHAAGPHPRRRLVARIGRRFVRLDCRIVRSIS